MTATDGSTAATDIDLETRPRNSTHSHSVTAPSWTATTQPLDPDSVVEASRIADASVPEGGYGWVVVGVSALMAWWFIGIPYCWGVLQEALVDQGLASASTLAFVGSSTVACNAMFSTTSSRIVRALGSQRTAMLGMGLISLGEILSGFCTKSVAGLFVCTGLILGIGISMCFMAVSATTPQYFNKKRGIANGCVYAGGGLGGALISIAMNKLIQAIGIAWTFRLMGLLTLTTGMPAAWFVKERNPFGSRKFIEWRLFKDYRFLAIFMAGAIGTFPLLVPPFFLPLYASSVGLPTGAGAGLVAGFNFASAVGRIGCGFLSDAIGPLNTLLVSFVLTAVSMLALWPLSQTLAPLVIFVIINGAANGGFFSTMPTVVGNVFGSARMVPDDVSFPEAALLEPLSVVLHGIRRAKLTLGRGAVICGAGPIGLIALLAARASGACPLVITDLESSRLTSAKGLVPECQTYQLQRNSSAETEAENIRSLYDDDSEYECPETVLECTGAESSIITAAFAVRRGGTVLVIGLGRPIVNNIPFMHLSLAEIDIKFVNRYTDTWPAGIAALKAGLIDMESLVTHVFPLDGAVDAMHICADLNQGSIKVQIVDDIGINPEDIDILSLLSKILNIMANEVAVLIGTGSIGLAIIRRIAAGRTLLLADYNEQQLASIAELLRNEGYDVQTQATDISKQEAVAALAKRAASLGSVTRLVHAAGVSPNQAPPKQVIDVDLLGTDYILEYFGEVMDNGGSGIVVSSQAGHMGERLSAEVEYDLAYKPVSELQNHPILSGVKDSMEAYILAKRSNTLRVQAEAITWGQRGARINSISPGIICTPLARHELASPSAALYQKMIKESAAGRMGNPSEVGEIAALLLDERGAFVTGTDLLMDVEQREQSVQREERERSDGFQDEEPPKKKADVEKGGDEKGPGGDEK
ncbi:MFS general substrate transporter, partial [Aureobasidium melanogenum]